MAIIRNAATAAPSQHAHGLPIEYCLKLVERIVTLVPFAIGSFAKQDFGSYWQAHDKLRSLSAELSDLIRYAKDIEANSATTSSHIEQIRVGIQIISKFNDFFKSEADRYSSVADTLPVICDEFEANWLIEFSLPLEWNFDADYLFIIGSPSPQLINIIECRNIKRWHYFSESEVDQTLGQNLFSSSLDHLKASLTKQFYVLFPKAFAVIHLYDSTIDAETRDLAETIATSVRFNVGSIINTMDRFGDRLLRQSLENLHRTIDFAHPLGLKNHFRGLPVVIVAPGPSLNINVELLREIAGRVVIITIAQALKALKSVGVIPHIVCVVDPQDMRHFFEGVPILDHQILFTKPGSHPSLFELGYKRISAFSYEEEAWINDLLGWEMIDFSWGSASLTAFALARFFEAPEIILVGQDLSVSNGRRYTTLQSQDSASIRDLSNANHLFKKLKAYDLNGFVETTSDLYVYHGIFETLARQMKADDSPCELINATEGGSYIEGFAHKCLSSVITEKYEQWRTIPLLAENDWHSTVSEFICIASVRKKTLELTHRIESILSLGQELRGVLALAPSKRRRERLGQLERNLADLVQPLPFFAIPFRRNIEHVRVLVRHSPSEEDLDKLMAKIVDILEDLCRRFMPYLSEFNILLQSRS